MAKEQVSLEIDGISVTVPANFTIMEAADKIGIHIPRLCHHPKLSDIGACRVCVVEVEGMKNYVPSCCTKVAENMSVKTTSPGIMESRKIIVELILDNHPKDCQICERNGHCELQSLAELLGIRELEFEGERKEFEKDSSSPAIVRDPDKCILCGRCVRVCSEIQGVNTLSYLNRGFKTSVGPAYDMPIAESVCINCGQCTLFCPTAALTETDTTARVWDKLNDPDTVTAVQIAPAVRVAMGEGFGMEPGTNMTYQTVTALRMLGFDIVFDTQFSADLTIMEEGSELIKRITQKGKLPMFTSCCPGWIKFCESFHPEFLENISTCKSPQQMMGSLIKTYYAKRKGIDPRKIFSVSIMPCTAKKFECRRPEMCDSGFTDVDEVLTTRELIRMIKQAGLKFPELKKSQFDELLGESSGAAPIFGATGGVMEAALRTAYELITKKKLGEINFNSVRGFDGIKEAEVEIDGITAKVAIVYGLVNTHRLLTEINEGKRDYHFVEVMTCPGGCLGGGGQPYATGMTDAMDKTLYEKRAAGLYSIDEKKTIRKSHENPQIKQIYADFLSEPLGKKSHHLLHTKYHKRKPEGVPSAVQKEIVSI